MKSLTLEMPLVSRCAATRCAYNQNHYCRAKAITIGDRTRPDCDTFFSSGRHKKNNLRIAAVGACKVRACQHNDDLECSADEISVSEFGDEVRCATYSPRKRAAA